jgi:hypothetical protein
LVRCEYTVLFCTSLYSKPNILSLPLKVKFTSPYIQIFMVRIWTLNSQIFWHPSGFYNKNQMQRKELLFVLFSMCFIRDAHPSSYWIAHHAECNENEWMWVKCVFIFYFYLNKTPKGVKKLTISGQNSHHKIYRYGDTNWPLKGNEVFYRCLI